MLKVAFVGCGAFQREHHIRAANMEGLSIVGHCDIDGQKAEAACHEFGGEAFVRHDTMFDVTKPDAVFISVPPFAHGAPELDAAKRGIHLHVEKPLAVDRKVAKAVHQAVRQTKVLASVGSRFRYYDTVDYARQFLRGKGISLISGQLICPVVRDSWRCRMALSGGQFHEQAAHLIDLLRYLCGDVSEVYAVAANGCMNHVKDFDVHESSVATLRLKSGAVASIACSCVTGTGAQMNLEIVTPEATVQIDGNGNLTVAETGKTTRLTPRVDQGFEESRAFAEALRTGKKNRIRSTYTDAYRTFLVTCAANESVSSGLPVKP